MSKMGRSWRLLRCGWQVFRSNRALWLFPWVQLFGVFAIFLFFMAPTWLIPTGHDLFSVDHWTSALNRLVEFEGMGSDHERAVMRPLAYVLLTGNYILCLFVVNFFNVAFYHEILGALNGRRASLARGLRYALSRIKPIAMWSLFTGLIGVLIRMLEEKAGFVGRWVLRLIGITFSVASVFAIPVIVRDRKDSNPLRFLRVSGSLIRKTWGESLLGYAGIGIVSSLLILALILVAVPAIVFAAMHVATGNSLLPLIMTIVLLLAALFLIGTFTEVVSKAYVGALFIYATEGVVPGPYLPEHMETGWKIKKQRKDKKSGNQKSE